MGTGGVELGLRRLVAGLDPDRFEHTICVVRRQQVDMSGLKARVVSLERPESPGVLLLHYRRMLKRERPHLLHTRNWGTMEAIPGARLANVPGIVHVEHGREFGELNSDPWRRRMFRKFCYARADKVLAVSSNLRDFYLRQLGLSADRMGVLGDAVDTELFAPDAQARARMRAMLNARAETLLVACVARLDKVKDHPTLFRAAELAAGTGLDIRVLLIGDGPERQALEALCQTDTLLKSRVIFVGQSDAVRDWLNAADVFAMSSVSEGTSVALLEAMAMRLPPLVTSVGGNPEIVVDGESGVLFGVGKSEALAASFMRAAREPAWRERLGEGARRRVMERFSFPTMLNAYRDLYLGILRSKVGRYPALKQLAEAGCFDASRSSAPQAANAPELATMERN